MKMVDLKLPKKMEKETNKLQPSMEREQWPYGMQLRFESEQVDKIPLLKEMNAEDKVTISGIGEIKTVDSQEEVGGKKRYTVTVQMQQIGVEGKGKQPQESMIDAMKEHKKNMTMKMGS